MADPLVRCIALTKDEADLLLDKVSVRHPETRTLGLKIAGIVLEFAADEALRSATVPATPDAHP